MLELKNVKAGYDNIIILNNVSLKINQGEFIAIIGPNGAGKSTCLNAIIGIIPPVEGEIIFFNKNLVGMATWNIYHLGLNLVSENGHLFSSMTVMENLKMGSINIKDNKLYKELEDYVFELFPRLYERKKQYAGTLSGGERKMLSIARSLMSNPKMIMVDEPSGGLAPNLADSVFDALLDLKRRGITLLMVEQNVNATLEITDRSYVLERGNIILEGFSAELIENDHIKKTYLGTA